MMEVLWVNISATRLGVDAASIAREVSASVFLAVGPPAMTFWIGLVVHFVLSLLISAAYAFFVWHTRFSARPGMWLIASVTSLAGIWAVNFFVLLPWLNPKFPTLLPLDVTFISKLLFAIALWGVFAAASRKVPVMGSGRRTTVTS